MGSIYANRVKTYGHHWYRPWLVFVFFLVVLFVLNWLAREEPPVAQVVCDNLPWSPYRAAVEVDGLVWTADIDAALACARKQDRRVFVAFHAKSDTNSLVNERTVFRDHRVKSALRGHVLVMLYIDFVPECYYQRRTDQEVQRRDGEANYRFEEQRFQTAQEPLYVVLQPEADGEFKIVAEYDETRIQDVNRFVRFLQNLASARHESR